MMIDNQDVDEAGSETIELLTPGVLLQKAREKKGLDVRAAADQLRMSRVKLIALEADAYAEFQGETFIRGYIKAYCRILGLDENEIIKCYEEHVAATSFVEPLIKPKEMKSIGLAFNDKRRLKPIYLATFCVVLLILSGLILFFQQTVEVENTGIESSATLGNIVASEPVVDVVGLEQGERSDETSVVNEAGPAEDVDVAPVAANSLPASADPVAINTDAPAQVGPLFDTLTITLQEECWVEVSDAKGDVLATELKEAGTELVLQGHAPFNVMLGNAKAATVFINGNLVNSNPRNSNRALRFSVDKP